RAWRFADTYRDPEFTAALARETYSDYYRLRFPYDADVAGRPRRLSPLNARLEAAGAVFGTQAGWERADLPRPRQPWARNGAGLPGVGPRLAGGPRRRRSADRRRRRPRRHGGAERHRAVGAAGAGRPRRRHDESRR